jgi:hypothetical protein
MSRRSVQIIGTDSKGVETMVNIDHFFGLLGRATLEEMAVAQGVYFGTGHYESNVVDAGKLEVLLKMPDAATVETIGLGGVLSSGGNALLEVFLNPTITDDGTALGILQVNQNSALTPNFTSFHSPSLSADGALIFRTLVPGGTGPSAVGGASSPFQRLMTIPSANYLIRATNISGQSQPMSMNANLVEIRHLEP